MTTSNDAPLVSVVIPTHNRWPLVLEAVQSVLQQDFGDFEVVVVDDGSTDGTSIKLAGIHPALRVLTVEHRERCAARNSGIAQARGQFVAFLDSDDLWEPWHLSQFAEAQRRNPEGAAFAASYVLWDPTLRRMDTLAAAGGSPEQLVHPLLLGTLAPTSALIVSREALSEIGGIPEDLEISGGEDWVLCIALAEKHSVTALERPSVRIRLHGGRSMQDPTRMMNVRGEITRRLLEGGAAGRQLTPDERKLLTAATQRFNYSNQYVTGNMRAARSELRNVRRTLGWRRGLRWTARLWLQTWLGRSGSEAMRRMRMRVLWRREPPGNGATPSQPSPAGAERSPT